MVLYLAFYQQLISLKLSPRKLPRLFQQALFNVYGQGGVGKTTLLRRFRQIAEDSHCHTASVSETEMSVPEVMGRLAEQLEQREHKLLHFSERYKLYRQKKQELEADPESPQGFSTFLGRSLAKA